MADVGKVKLNTGAAMPKLGYGTWQILFNVRKKVLTAIDNGYRLIDTAKIYGNEVGVGTAIRGSKVKREKLFVTTKLWTSDQGYDKAHDAFEVSLRRLGLDYIDLYLIHWPGRDANKREQSWVALEEINGSGRARAIGVSNYQVDHLEELLAYADIKPAVNQIEFHPYVYERQLPIVEFCKKQGIAVEAYSPLAHGRHMSDPVINEIATKHKATSAQIMLAWCLHHGTVPIPKSTHPERMKQNIEAVKIKLSKQEVEAINDLSRDESALGLH